MSQAQAGLLLTSFVAPACLICAYSGWTSGSVRLGITTHERGEEPLFYWWGMLFNTIGGVFCLIMGCWMLFR
ncbi:hypothetical protein [Novosphingobium sp.]|uniref:hypothetical protein n=1 Tax=Novosphingobium sp. TaxID=1874826 RepID=UPI0035AE6A93